MSVKTVQTTVIDIRKDVPQSRDHLFVDTNSWRNLTYTRIRHPKPEYLDYLKTALDNKATLYACGITLVELASTIEDDEWEIYRQTSSFASHKKMFRHECPDERKKPRWPPKTGHRWPSENRPTR